MSHLSVPATVVSFGAAEREAVMRVLESGRVVQGAEVAASSPSSPRSWRVATASP